MSTDLHVYEVGIASSVALVEAPSAEAAALFYGINTSGNMQLGAAVYKCDDEPYTGDNLPWGEFAFQFEEPSDEKLTEFHARIKAVAEDVREHCRFIEVES